MSSTVNLVKLVDQGPQMKVARVMQICNACRYCEGFCAVFPAMERRRTSVPVMRRIWPICATIAGPVIMPANMPRRMNLA